MAADCQKLTMPTGMCTVSLQGFLDKNRDLMRPDILSVLKNSNSRFVRDLLGKLATFVFSHLPRRGLSIGLSD